MGKARRMKWVRRSAWPLSRFANLDGQWALRKMLVAMGRIDPELPREHWVGPEILPSLADAIPVDETQGYAHMSEVAFKVDR